MEQDSLLILHSLISDTKPMSFNFFINVKCHLVESATELEEKSLLWSILQTTVNHPSEERSLNSTSFFQTLTAFIFRSSCA